MTTSKFISGCVVLSMAMSSAAGAATITVSGGSVSMNTGAGWAPVAGSATATVGTKVMAAKDSEGQIVYADGCFERVKAGAVKAIKAVSPCVNRSGAGLKDDPGPATADPRAGWGIDPAFLVAAAVAGVVIAVVASNNDDDPASP